MYLPLKRWKESIKSNENLMIFLPTLPKEICVALKKCVGGLVIIKKNVWFLNDQQNLNLRFISFKHFLVSFHPKNKKTGLKKHFILNSYRQQASN